MMSQQAEKLARTIKNVIVLVFCCTELGLFPTSLPFQPTKLVPLSFSVWLSFFFLELCFCALQLSLHPCSPFILPLWFFDPRHHQNGGIRTISDLRHYVRDHQPVRLAQSYSPRTCIKSRNTKCRRYTDLQPVGMGAFGLVW